jgi:hypothetical protein
MVDSASGPMPESRILMPERIRPRSLFFGLSCGLGTSTANSLATRLALLYLVDTETVLESAIRAAAPVILASFSKRLFHAKKHDLTQIFVGSSQRRAVS